MILSNKTIYLLVLVATGLILATAALAESNETGNNKVGQRHHNRLPRLFDFEHYKSVFKKKYNSLREDIVRRKIVLAKAFRAFISGIAYKFKRTRFYLALNEGSDRTPSEILRSIPKIRPLRSLNESQARNLNPDKFAKPPKPELADEEIIEKGLDAIKKIAADQHDPLLASVTEELGESRSRSKRSATKESPIRKNFSLGNLLKTPKPPKKRAGVLKSNNPTYESPEMTSMGSDSPTGEPMSEDLIREILSDDEKEADDEDMTIGSYIGSIFQYFSLKPNDDQSDDVRFVDHSVSPCMADISNQGDCGSCYAFAMTAMFAWLICQQTGVLAPISEQYMVDCGPETEYYDEIAGCDGGIPEDAAGYFVDYGVELARNYPYVAKQGKCPYDDTKNNTKMGYLRLNPGASSTDLIPYEGFEIKLKHMPIIISIGYRASLVDYGGGVHDGKDCCREVGDICGIHAVVLVGQGREDGEDYWLIRNSYGTSYGEEGYLRLSKKSDCIWPKYGVIYGHQPDAGKIPLILRKNEERSDNVEAKINDMTRYKNLWFRWRKA